MPPPPANFNDDDCPSDWDNDSDDEKVPPAKQTAAPSLTAPITSSPAPQTPAARPAAPKKQPDLSLEARLRNRLDCPDHERERLCLVQELRDVEISGEMMGVSKEDAIAEITKRTDDLLKAASALAAQSEKKKGSSIGTDDGACVELERMADINRFCDSVDNRILNSQAKSAVWLRLMDRMFTTCSIRMSAQDLKTLQRKVQTAVVRATAAQNAAATSSKKGTDLSVNVRDPLGELAIHDGDDSESEDDEYEAFM